MSGMLSFQARPCSLLLLDKYSGWESWYLMLAIDCHPKGTFQPILLEIFYFISWHVRRTECISVSVLAQRPITCVPCLHRAEGLLRGLLWDGGVSSPFHGISKPQQASRGSKSRGMECSESSESLDTFCPALISVISILNDALWVCTLEIAIETIALTGTGALFLFFIFFPSLTIL